MMRRCGNGSTRGATVWRLRSVSLLLICAVSLRCEVDPVIDFEAFRVELEALSDTSEVNRRLDVFMERVETVGTPIIENDTTALFLYRGPATSVRMMGDMTNWSPEIAFERLPGTDLHYHRGTFLRDARMEYTMQSDSSLPFPDPRNPNRVLSGFGPFSELAMPGYDYLPVFSDVRDGTPGGYDRVTRHELPAGLMGYRTEIHVYTPPGYESTTANLPTLYVMDGRDYIEFAHTPAVLDYLVESREIRPILAVFVSPPNRHQPDMPNRVTEYGLNPDYARFMAEELVPFVESRYRAAADPAKRMVAGDSFAGLFAVYLPFQHPEVFGIGYGQSSYVSLNGDTVVKAYADAPRRPIRLFVDVGVFERQVGKGWLPDDEIDFLEGNRRFRTALDEQGYDFVYREYPEGHTWGNWRAHLADAVGYFFPPATSTD